MKELITKSFWKGVTKTFHDALEGVPSQPNIAQAPEVVPAARSDSPAQSSSDAHANVASERPERQSD